MAAVACGLTASGEHCGLSVAIRDDAGRRFAAQDLTEHAGFGVARHLCATIESTTPGPPDATPGSTEPGSIAIHADYARV
jgi:hypothetical protein